MLKPKAPPSPSDPNALGFAETVRGFERGELGFYVDRGRALMAGFKSVPLGNVATYAGLAMLILPVIGIVLGLAFTWQWFAFGLLGGFAAFQFARSAAVASVRRLAFEDEGIFHKLRDSRTIWFERRT